MISILITATFVCGKSASQIFVPDKIFTESQAAITALEVNSERDLLVCGDEKGNIILRNLADGSFVKSVAIHGNAVNFIRFNSTGKLMISSTNDGEIKIFDFEKDKVIQGIYSPDYNGLRFVLFSIADGFIYFNSTNRLFKTRSDLTQKVELVYSFEDSINDAVITPDRNALIISCGKTLKVINTRSDILRQELYTGESPAEHIRLLGDSLLVSWSTDGFIRYWPYSGGQLEIKPSYWFKAGIPATMNFSTDGALMVSGNTGSWARVWDPFKRTIRQELFSHEAKVTGSAFGKESTILFTAGQDRKVIRWIMTDDTTKAEKLQAIKQQEIPVPVPLKPEIARSDSQLIVQDVVMDEENTPAMIQGRQVSGTVRVEVQKPEMTIYVFDNSYFDGDTMSLFFNGKWILDHYGVTKKKKVVELQFLPNTNNYLVLFANNLGKSPPNTAAVEIDDGRTKRIFRLSSDLRTCSAINFIYNPEDK